MEQNSNHVKAILRGCVRADLDKKGALAQIKSYLPEGGKGKDEAIKSAINKSAGDSDLKSKDLGKFLDGLVSSIFSASSKSLGDSEVKSEKKSR
ncbi:hypothetical protein KAR91_86440 [Candidatus Pacearchaeota archaeon]|nr:hypothetical protein [Candidatus Pacearchaeota archaeon]